MGTQPEPSPAVIFGPFEYDPTSGDLRKFGNRIRLQGKPLQILSLLLERAGQGVSREELQRELWQGTTFVDFEQGLNSAVNKLRQALGDAAEQPRYVETLPGRGYRFIAPLQRTAPKTVLEIAPPAAVPLGAKKPTRPGARTLAAGGLALAALVGFGYWLGTRHAPVATPRSMTRFTIAPPAGFALEGAHANQSLALSPDGRKLAFTAVDSSGAFSAFVRDLDSIEVRPIPESVGVHSLFWPSDGRSLFLAVRGKLRRAQLDKPGHVVLAEATPLVFSGTWIDSSRLMLSTRGGTFTISPNGGPMLPVNGIDRWPQLLPDGRHVLYMQWAPGAPRHRAMARPLEGGEAKFLLETDSRVQYAPSISDPNSGYLFYVRAGNLLAHPFDLSSLSVAGEAIPVANKVYSFFPTGAADFSVSPRGTIAYQSFVSRSQLVWVNRKGETLGTIGPANVNVKSGRLSPDGHKIAAALYDTARGATSLWIFDTATSAARELTRVPGLRDAPVWPPGSGQIAYLHAFRDKPPQVYLSGLEEGAKEEILTQDQFGRPVDWSPDGRFISYVNSGSPRFPGDNQSDISLIDLARGRKLIPLLHSPFLESNPVFSPDGRWLAFTSDESGDSQLYVQAFDGGDFPRLVGERFPVSRAGAVAVRWRRDGREIFYLAFDGRVYAATVTLGAKPTFGPSQPLFTIGAEARAAIHSAPGFDVSADGQRFVVPTVAADIAPPSLVVIQNWEAGLKH